MPAAHAGRPVAVVALSFALNLVPYWNYQREHGRNPAALPQRDLMATESNSLKLAQMLLPTPLHRVGKMREVQQRYAAGAPLVAENQASSLGFVGSVGLLLLGLNAMLALGGRALGVSPGISWLSFLTGVAIAFASVGGLDSLFVMFVSPLIRGWNRISIFVGLFAVGAFAMCAQQLCQTMIRRHSKLPAAALAWIGGGAIATFAAWDQTPLLDQAAAQKSADEAREFFARVQDVVPRGALVFQLPYWAFPEGGRTPRWPDYAHLRGYLYTSGIGWTYGAMKGRDADKWYRMASLMPAGSLAQWLPLHGFSGLYVDRSGYADEGKSAVAQLDAVLGRPDLLSRDGKLLFYRLRPAGPARPDFTGLMDVRRVPSLPPARGACSIDSASTARGEHGIRSFSGEQFEIGGWVGDVATGFAPKAASIYLVGDSVRLQATAFVGLRRDDVAAAMGKPGLAESGFMARVPTSRVPAGRYTVGIGFEDAGGSWICPTHYEIKVTGSAGS